MRRRNSHTTETAPPPEQLENEVPPVPDPDATGDTAAPPVDVAEAEAAESGSRAPVDELDEQRDKYLRLAAEFDNYRRRAMRERSEAGTRGQAELVRQLLEALDDLARFAHLDPATTEPATVVQGAEMVERKLLKTLAAAGLEIVDPVDQPFDPARQEAVATEPAASLEQDHTVARVYQPGYVFKGQLLRPARVVVRQWAG
jgi:molecular chaperone GrpE